MTILQIVLPLLLCIGGMALVVSMFFSAEKRRAAEAYREKSIVGIMPTRLQAYERMALYIERISPERMVPREQMKVKTAMEFHSLMTNTIRQEFEHNIAMQIYISSASWGRIIRAREEIIKCINEAAKTTNPKASSLELGRKVVEASANDCAFYINRALEGLRRDVNDGFTKN